MTRVSRGFHRIGIVLAAIMMVTGALIFQAEYRNPTGARKEPGALTAEERKAAYDRYLLAEINRGGDLKPVPESNVFWIYDESAQLPRTINYEPAAWCFVAGLLAYAAFRSFGWIIDGFGR